MATKPKKRKSCYCKWQIDEVVAKINDLQKQLVYLKQSVISTTVVIYSSGTKTAIGNTGDWHKIVCLYEGDKCIGTPVPHWHSHWDVREDGFHLKMFLNEQWKGWNGQYAKSELRYDQLPNDVMQVHHNALCDHMKKLGIWYPCHIYNDFTGELHRP